MGAAAEEEEPATTGEKRDAECALDLGLNDEELGALVRKRAMRQREQWQRVAPLVDEMLRAGPSLDMISFRAAMSACMNGGHLQHVVAMLDDMCRPGLPLDVISFTAAISAYVRGGRW
eukprot:5552269-Karenia_brevis.AAC.1